MLMLIYPIFIVKNIDEWSSSHSPSFISGTYGNCSPHTYVSNINKITELQGDVHLDPLDPHGSNWDTYTETKSYDVWVFIV